MKPRSCRYCGRLEIIFYRGFKANACNIILSHNHPSGNLKPSRADEELTKKIATAAMYLDIKVIDQIIVTSGVL